MSHMTYSGEETRSRESAKLFSWTTSGFTGDTGDTAYSGSFGMVQNWML